MSNCAARCVARPMLTPEFAMRRLLTAGIAIVLVAAIARADRMPDQTPLLRVVSSPVSVIGKVSSLDRDTVEASSYPGVKEKTKYTIATVKVETNIRGAKGVTHLKVGFYPGSSGTGGSYKFPVLKDGQDVCLFLNKHHEANFYVFPPLAPPLDVTEGNKATVEMLKRAAVVFDDSAKALKSAKAEDRLFAAGLLVVQYRTQPFGRASASEPIPLEESQAILKILAGADWTQPDGEASTAFVNLGIANHPKFAKIRPKPGDDLKALWLAEFKRWLVEDGKDYRIEKFVPKAK